MDYKKILEGVVDIINTTEKSDIGFTNICTYISENCPELKESEDERIKNFIANELACIRATDEKGTCRYKELTKAIAWLEKQGEHADFRNKIQIGDKVTRNEDGILVNISQLNRVAKKQCEQKHTDKVEPRFKVGDWITNSKCTWKIDSIDEDMYYNNHCGIDCGGDIKSIDEEYHLWTIQDAKNGDVLSYRDGQWIFIYKNYVDDNSFEYYALYSTIHQDLTINDAGFTLLGDAITPATKEQRDTLMKAMADSGYEWDAEKKELKKIEQTPNDEIGNYDHGKVLDALMSAKKTPKPAWSEEDKKMSIFIGNAITADDASTYLESKGIQVINAHVWLDELKDRVQPQSHWKPSDEQITWLYRAADDASKDSRMKQILNELLSDLKKLREG